MICCAELQSGGDCTACGSREEKTKRTQTTTRSGKERAKREAEKRKRVPQKIQSEFLCIQTVYANECCLNMTAC